ncbi:MAG: HEAT repeat domain-containing protein [Acidobacteriota bacterium]
MSTAEVEAFVNSLLSEYPGPRAKISQFRFSPLEQSGIHLVATTDFSGREQYFQILVISPYDGSSFRYFELSSAPPHFLPTEVIDIDGDGIYELVLRELVGDYQGAETLPVFWFSIHRFQDGKIVDVSPEYKEYYLQTLLPKLAFELRIASELAAQNSEYQYLFAAQSFIRSKFRRRILGELKAGFKEAVNWSKSEDIRIQFLSIKALEEIGDPESISILTELSTSEEQRVATRSNRALARLR